MPETEQSAVSRCFSAASLTASAIEAPSKGYFAPADRDPDHVQRIQNGDSSTEVEILYVDGRLNFIACASLIE